MPSKRKKSGSSQKTEQQLETTTSPIKRRRIDLTETITICAGDEDSAKNFVLHKSFATKSSKFIAAALSHDWKEGQEKHISLPEVNVATFEGYLHWLYTGLVTLNDMDTGTDSTYLQLVQMYILGDYLDDTRFCNAVVDEWSDDMSDWDDETVAEEAGWPSIKLAWTETMYDSPLRSRIIEQWKPRVADSKKIAWLRTCAEEHVPREFLIDLLAQVGESQTVMSAKERKDKLQRGDKCKFHKHVDDTDRCE